MKKDIHPKYFNKITVNCACGNKIEVGCTLQNISIDVCSKCHPFYTGKNRLLDTEGRIAKFNKKFSVNK